MNDEYIKMWLHYRDIFSPFTAEEVGRLVLAMLEYRATGKEPDFTGNERYVWPTIRRDIDAQVSALEDRRTTLARNGKKGGRPKGSCTTENQMVFQDDQKNQMVFSEGEKNQMVFQDGQKNQMVFRDNQKNQMVFSETKESHKQKQYQEQKQEQKQKQGSSAPSGASAEAVQARSAPDTAVFIQLPLVDGTMYDVTQAQVDDWCAAFPELDVEQSLRSAVSWCINNPGRRKTRRGASRFLNGWISGDFNAGTNRRKPAKAEQPRERKTYTILANGDAVYD